MDKFKEARALRRYLPRIKEHIEVNLASDDVRRRKTATVTFLIDHCKFRVGDEKDDEEEADTVGASSLRPEHITFNGDGRVTFDFLGKDSVRHNLCVEVPEQVTKNLKEFGSEPDRPLFEGVDSKQVSNFLDEVKTGLTAKIFRTYYATRAVEGKLNRTRVDLASPDYLKKHVATLANLAAAKICNHRRTIPKTWELSLQRKKDRLKVRMEKSKAKQRQLKKKASETEKKYTERLKKYEEQLTAHKEKLEEYKRQLDEMEKQGKATKSIKNRITSKRKSIKTQKERVSKLKKTHKERMGKQKTRLERTKVRDDQAIEKLKLQIEVQRETRDYNLGTSLKSYVDPRIYYDWGNKVEYDWKKYYSKTLQRKFSWVEKES